MFHTVWRAVLHLDFLHPPRTSFAKAFAEASEPRRVDLREGGLP